MIIFRADGNERIGAGHIMRCLSIADAAKDRGISCVFILADNSFETVIEERGYPCSVLNTIFSDMDDELQLLIRTLEQINFELIIVDSYYVTDKYLSTLRQCGKVVYIDDFMNVAYPVDVVVNYNIYSAESVYRNLYEAKGERLPRFVLGARYVPLRKEFLNIKKNNISKNIKKVLVSTGGADVEHIALKFLQHLFDNSDYMAYEFHFIIGVMNQDIDDISKLAERLSNVILHHNVKEMKELMTQCDVALSAAGSTLYELCACGIPTITYVSADNQIQAEKCFVEAKVMETVGDVRRCQDFFAKIVNVLEYLNSHLERREQMATLGRSLVDGTGASNIINELQRIAWERKR